MKRTLAGLALVLAPTAAALEHDLMPAPASLRFESGALPIDARFSASALGKCDERVPLAMRRLTDSLSARLKKQIAFPTWRAAKASLTAECAAAGAEVQELGEDESYTLSVTPAGARIVAPTSLGALWGIETFRQLVRDDAGKLEAPAVYVEDKPRFAWRGLTLDTARHFMPVETVKRTLDGMTAVKLNVLHWHLSDDQGFRVESRSHPRLYQAGASGLFYTWDQVKDVIDYARDRGIRVVPEFDVPGHATAWLAGQPELATLPGVYAIERKWGIFDATLDPSRDEVYAFLGTLFGEMAALFPDAYFHIGGDEVTGRHWNMSPRVRQFAYEKGFKDNEALHAYFNARIGAILGGLKKRIVGWDEILNPDLPKGAVVHSWRGAESLAEAARQGYDAILSNGWYLDHMQTAAFHYAVDPFPANSTLSNGERARVRGGEACMWAEFVTPETLDSRVWPRAVAIAERLWSPAELRDPDDMYRRLAIASRRLEERGLQHASNYEPMLRRLAGEGQPIEALKRLADVVEPVKLYNRGQSRLYTQLTPLDRLVDAARPESDQARAFRRDVDAFLASAPAFEKGELLRARVQAWALNHKALDPVLARREALAEIRPLSRNLSALGVVAGAALDQIAQKKAPPPEWQADATNVLERARVPLAEVEIAVLRGVQKLVLAAQRIERLAATSPVEWNAAIETELQPKPRPQSH